MCRRAVPLGACKSGSRPAGFGLSLTGFLARPLEGLEAGVRHRVPSRGRSFARSFAGFSRGARCVVVVVVGDERREGAKSRHLTLKKLSQTLKACAKGHVICRTVRTEVRVQWPAPHVGSNLNDRCHALSR